MLRSPPSRRRGLKLKAIDKAYPADKSPPSRRRGLKLIKLLQRDLLRKSRLLRGGVD